MIDRIDRNFKNSDERINLVYAKVILSVYLAWGSKCFKQI